MERLNGAPVSQVSAKAALKKAVCVPVWARGSSACLCAYVSASARVGVFLRLCVCVSLRLRVSASACLSSSQQRESVALTHAHLSMLKHAGLVPLGPR
jgi:hypothetical protein